MRRILPCLFLLLLAAPPSQAQDLLSPAEFLGHELGSRFTPHHRVVDYVLHVASASDRVQVETYGETVEGRPLLLAFIARPDRLDRLEEIRRDNLRLVGTIDGEPSDEDHPALVWLSYNVHGNESVSTEASMAVLYDLARPDHQDATGWLDDVVVMLDPCINPDGRDRYVSWYNRVVGVFPDANPVAVEHSEEWPGGRTNHYYFDLNRDWSWLSQKETRARIARYNAWMPHVHVDFHEQGVDDPYYFAPAAEPYHPVITHWQREFQTMIGANNAAWFDREGWLYFTRERFDLFYPGYGDTYPTYLGAIGMTYEQGGSGRAGLGIETAEGDTLTLADRIAHHHATSLSTVEVTARHADRVVREFGAFFDGGTDELPWRTFVMRSEAGTDRLAAMAAHLDALGIRSGTVSERIRVRGRDYRSAETVSAEVRPGDLVVSVDQPRGVMAHVLLEPDPELPDSSTYDITAWALPYAYGTDALALDEDIEVDAGWVPATPLVPAQSTPPYAYAMPWSSPRDVEFLARVLQSDVSARVATEPFTAAGEAFEAGTVVITRRGNETLGDRLGPAVLDAANDLGRRIVTLESGRVEDGKDLGSSSVRFVSAPRIAMAFGEGTSSSSTGQVWHWFDERVRYPVTRIAAERIGSIDLDAFDVLILPSGSYRESLDEEGLSRLRRWIADGGRVVAVGGALSAFAGKDGFSLERVGGEDEAPDSLRTYADRNRDRLSGSVPGAVFTTRVDASHPLGFGLEAGYFTLRRGGGGYAYLDGDRTWNVGVIQKDARRSGFVGREAASRIGDTLSFGVEEIGRGAIVYFVDDPLYRAFWYEGTLLFGNAVFMPLR